MLKNVIFFGLTHRMQSKAYLRKPCQGRPKYEAVYFTLDMAVSNRYICVR